MEKSDSTLISQPSLSFYDFKSGKIESEIWSKLDSGLWKNFTINNWLSNELLLPNQIQHQKNLFSDVLQILPGTKWDVSKKTLIADLYSPKISDRGMDRYMAIIAEYIEGLNARKIGVHLSGGLDSSLIIATLRHLGIPFVPIGMVSKRYEFRTERVIQEILLQWGSDGELIDYDECPFYSNLESFPATQIPSSFYKSFTLSTKLAERFRDKGCDVVLGGQGGDSLFVDAVDDFSKLSFNINDEFVVPDEQELIYAPRGIRLLSVFAHKPLIDFICTERIGQNDDPLKWWARNYFKDILPRELSQYAYFGDFFAMTMKGLDDARPVIQKLMANAYEWTSDKIFSPQEVRQFLSQDIFSFEHKDYIKFCSLIAVAVWYNSLHRSNIIK